jgi:predicted nuclease of predicted toxin-antitoxin system
MQDGRIVVSKDADFVQSFLITGEPPLLLISTGNVDNTDLEKILRANLSGIEAAFAACRFVEITRDALVMHE